MSKKIVIIGAGYAGVLTAKKLAKRLRKTDAHITIIDKNPFHTMLTELHEVAASRVPEDHIRISLKKIFAGRRVNVVLDTVTSVDPDNKTVVGMADSYSYDYLVLACGSKPTFFGTKGAEENSFTLWSYDDAIVLKHHITNMFKTASLTTDSLEKRKLLTFYVVGAGFTGVEMVGELAEWVPILCEEYEIDRDFIKIVNVDMLDRVVTTFPEKVSAKAARRLSKMGVEVILSTSVLAVGEDFIELKQSDKVIRDSTATVIWTAGIEGAEVLAQQKCLMTAGRCRIQTDEFLRAKDQKEIYVAGDNVFYIPENQGTPVPQMVENAEQSADTVAHNIASEVTGTGEKEKYKPKFHGAMLSIGGRYASAYVGTDKNKVSLASFFAMFSKHFINIIYFLQVAGWNKISHYLKYEFFTIRNRRSFVGGHFSNRSPSFMLVPLRLWLGAVWVFEGIMKVVEGWMKTPKLEGFFNGANKWYEAVLNSAGNAVTQNTDVVSGATGVGGGESTVSAGTVIFNSDILGLFKGIFVSGKPLVSSTISDYAFKLDIPLLNSFLSNIVLAKPGLSMAMQIFIVVVEILVGLSMIGGLLTTFSSFVSIILLFMFVTTTGLFLSSFWMIFGAIALMFGAGRVFGLDYYASPLLKRGWKNVGWVRRLYIYHD